jgi:alternate signal-mediated exported protein
MNKRRAVLGGTLLLLTALLAWGTWAYFTTEAHITNVITTGTINIRLEGSMTYENNISMTGAMPGVEAPRTVCVANAGDDAWVRVKVDTVIKKGKKFLSPTFGDSKLPVVELGITQVDDTSKPHWIYDGDKYYYYSKPLAEGTSTESLLEYIKLNAGLTNEYQNSTVSVSVNAQAVQVKNNDNNGKSLTAETLSNVKGWPADPKDNTESKQE